jgi:hypothetical protein
MNNNYYKNKTKGELFPKTLRIITGGLLLLLVLLVLFGPMFIFSTFQFVGTINPIQETKMNLDLVVGNVHMKLFETSSMIYNKTLNETQFRKLNFT